MGVITKLFGRKARPSPPVRDITQLIAPLSRPAVHLIKSSGESRSHLGGNPSLPAGIAWPVRNRSQLSFLACLNLESLTKTSAVPWLPPSGRLLFFYDTETQPWGFDPRDRGAWVVMLTHEQEGA